MMTRKDYVETAKILNMFVNRIPRFDENKFYDACTVDVELELKA